LINTHRRDAIETHEHVPTPEEQPIDVRTLSEAQLIAITADIDTALTPLGEQAFDEYMRRRGEVINQAIVRRADENAL
jgi:hypothetical protein